MVKISDLEEKKLIVAYSMARTGKHIGIENVWRQWCIRWQDDFSVNGRALRMYDHILVKSKTKTRERVRAGETDIREFKEYDDFLAELCVWLEENYDKTVSKKCNAEILKEKLVKYKSACGHNIRILLKKSGLKGRGYRLQNQTSKKHPQTSKKHSLLLGRYLIFHKGKNGIQECVAQGTYEEMVNWINNKTKEKNEAE